MSGGIPGRGKPGPQGPQGPIGPTGPQGPAAFTLAIGQVTAVTYGEDPAVVNVGTSQDQIWDLALPTGATGVLTGSSLPTGTDGTSLGQLYYCTTNQTYYSLVELNENDNKWRPFMTQDTAIREYHLDILAEGVYGLAGYDGVIGVVDIKMDDVHQNMTVAYHLSTTMPIGDNTNQGYALAVDARTHSKLKADAVSCGVAAIPLTGVERVNGVNTSKTWDLLSETAYAEIGSLSKIFQPGSTVKLGSFQPADGDGSNPGSRMYLEAGTVKEIANSQGAPAATTFGNAPGANRGFNPDDLLIGLSYKIVCDGEYPKEVRFVATEVIPYA